MENIPISLSYLETLSTADLLELAEEYDLDIPEQLNRRFIISEILEIADELNEEISDDFEESEEQIETTKDLPFTYNETSIDVVLRNPAWAYVYWDIRATDIQDVINSNEFSNLLLKIHFWESEKADKVIDVCELTISEDDRAQYIFLPSGKKYFSIDLIAEFSNLEPKKLTTSRIVTIPTGAPVISLESLEKPISPILQHSGMQELLKTHYQNHRQSFS
jgi:hypothetical protein